MCYAWTHLGNWGKSQADIFNCQCSRLSVVNWASYSYINIYMVKTSGEADGDVEKCVEIRDQSACFEFFFSNEYVFF